MNENMSGVKRSFKVSMVGLSTTSHRMVHEVNKEPPCGTVAHMAKP